MPTLPFDVVKVAPHIYHVNFTTGILAAMTFCRYQEYYESPNPNFRGQDFDLFDFIEWYSMRYGDGAFTYPVDWAGFNVPIKLIQQCYLGVSVINKYDVWMRRDIVEKGCKNDSYGYLIGTSGEYHDENTFKHELAHAFFYTDEVYRNEATYYVDLMPPKARESVFQTLRDLGYTEEVLVDETQAYFATGLCAPLMKKKSLKKYCAAFELMFNVHKKRLVK